MHILDLDLKIICICAFVCTCVYEYLWRPEEGVSIPEAGVARGCAPPNLGAGNWTQVICKGSKQYE